MCRFWVIVMIGNVDDGDDDDDDYDDNFRKKKNNSFSHTFSFIQKKI